jgi:hypothetical protein
MTKQIESVPESITREQYMSWYRNCGFDPRDVVSLKFTGKGVYAKLFQRDENGQRIDEGGPNFGYATNSVFIPVYPYGDTKPE